MLEVNECQIKKKFKQYVTKENYGYYLIIAVHY